MIRNFLFLPLLLAAFPAAAQDAEEATPRGTYLVYADEEGAAFVSVEDSLARSGVWPLGFFYFEEGAIAGSARMRATADCGAGVVSGTLTEALGPYGQPLELPPSADIPAFAFDRVAGGGDAALVTFICGTRAERLGMAETPVAGVPQAVALTYSRLRALGLEDRLARSLAIRDLRTAEPLIGTAVPQSLREEVRAAMTAP